MRNFRLLFALLVMPISLHLMAQEQQGLVKTLGRPNIKGQTLSGVTIRAKGAHNAVLSKNDGSFAMPMPGKKNGEPFSFQQVQKSGYVLNDEGVIGRLYAFSNKTPITIVMISTKLLNEEKLRIENNAYTKADNDYKTKLDQLEQQKNNNIVTEEMFRHQLQNLQNWYGKYQALISDLADHYAHTDYDDLDENERQINIAIENGELEKAELLLSQLGIQKHIEDVSKRLMYGERIKMEAAKDLEAVQKQQKKDGEYLFQLYTIALGRFDNEKARFYIETRAELDTTNVEWQLEAGQYFSEYLADYSKAVELIERGLRNAKILYGEQSEQAALSYIKLADVFVEQKDIEKSKRLYIDAYNIRKVLYPNNHPLIADCYTAIGGVFSLQGNFSEAMDYQNKAIEIRKAILTPPHEDLSQSYFNLGYVQACTGDFAEGLNNLQKSLEMLIAIHGEQYIHVADAYHNIGYLYMMIGKYDEAEKYMLTGMKIRKQLFGDNHPDLSESQNGLGNLYLNKGNYQESLSFFLRALENRLVIFGEMNRATATSYNNVGVAYGCLGNEEKEQAYSMKALDLSVKLYEDSNPELGIRYLNTANMYHRHKKLDEALVNSTKALNIFMKSYNTTNHPNVAQCYNMMGVVYGDAGNYKEAIEMHKKALEIRKSVLGDKHFDTATSYNNIGYILYLNENYIEAIDYYTKAYNIFYTTVGSNHPQIQSSLGNIDMAYKKYLAEHPDDFKVVDKYLEFKKDHMNKTSK